MKRHTATRKLSLLDPNVPVEQKNVSRKFNNYENQENLPKKRKQAEDDGIVARKVRLFSSNNTTGQVSAHNYKTVQEEPEVLIWDELSLTSAYLTDILDEEVRLGSRNMLSKTFCNNPHYIVTPYHREVAVEWLIDIQLSLNLGNDALHLAVSLMDIVLDTHKVKEDDIQVIAAAAMWLAHKCLYGGIKANLILKFCKTISLKQLLASERRILQATSMNLSFANATTVLNGLLLHTFGNEIPRVEYHMSHYLLEVMLLVADFVCENVVERAAVAISTALLLLKSSPKVAVADGKESTVAIQKRLLSTLRKIRNSKLFREKSSLVRKYSSPNYKKVSLHLCLNLGLVDS